jgi:V-ATPase subunit C
VQAFSAWIHVCAIRLFVESILRYGLPPRFLAVLMKPNPKGVAKLRKVLASTFGQKGALKPSTCVQPLCLDSRSWIAEHSQGATQLGALHHAVTPFRVVPSVHHIDQTSRCCRAWAL